MAYESQEYVWTDGEDTFSVNDNLIVEELDIDHLFELGLYKVYDAGQRLFVKQLN